MNGEDRLTGADAMAEYLGISRRHFFRLKRKCQGTDNQAPIFKRLGGEPGRRHRIIWAFKLDIKRWYYRLQNL